MSWGRRGHGVELGVELVLRIKQKQKPKKKNDVSSGGKEKLSKKGKVIHCVAQTRALFMQCHHDVSHDRQSEQNDTGGQEVLMQVLGWGYRGETQKVN